MINKIQLVRAGLAATALLVGVAASATTIITPAGPGLIGTSDENANCEPGCFDEFVPGSTLDWDLLYKADQKNDSDPVESGFLTGSYQTTFSNSPNDPEDALIEYVGGPYLVCDVAFKCILVVKDGNQEPNQYFFDLFVAGWDGQEDLFLDGFFPGGGAISHVSIWGPEKDNCCDQDVPEPGTLGLLGFGLLGFALSRRRRLLN